MRAGVWGAAVLVVLGMPGTPVWAVADPVQEAGTAIPGRAPAAGEETVLRSRLEGAPADVEAARSLAGLLERSGRGLAAVGWRRTVLAEATGEPARAQATLELGVTLVEAGQAREAIPLLRALTEREPGNEPADFELGTALARDEQFQAAAEAFRRAATLNPKDAEAQLSAAKSLVTLLRYAEAEPFLTAAASAGANAAEIHGLRGVVDAHTGRAADGIREFQAALVAKPDDAEMQLHLGEALRSVGRVQEAIAPLTRSAELAPTVAAYFQLARSYRALGDAEKEKAAEERRRQVESDLATAHTIAALEEEGARAAEAKDFAKAAESYRAALGLQPGNADLLYRAALIEGQRQDLRAERRLLEQALALTPEAAGPMGELGTIEGLQGETSAAERHLLRAVQLDPQNGVALRNLAVLRAQAGDLRGATALLRSAVESDGQDASAFRSLGLVFAAQGRMPEAEKALRRSSELEPSDAATAVALGQLFLSEGRPKEAAEALRRAATEQPAQVAVHALLARALLGAGDAPGAMAETRRVLALAPGSRDGLALKEELCSPARKEAAADPLCATPATTGGTR